jgi:fluoroquinolone resistance protein
MNRVFNEGRKFENLNLRHSPLESGEYEECIFRNCDFSNSDLSGINFIECEFQQCNLSLVKLTGTVLNDVKFLNCKLLGLHFDDCNDMMISFEFDNCTLDICSFYKLKLKRTLFNNSKIVESDFTETDLDHSSFNGCDLLKTQFFNTNLVGVDFRNAMNYTIDPDQNRIRKAKFSIPGTIGLLDKYDIEIEI